MLTKSARAGQGQGSSLARKMVLSMAFISLLIPFDAGSISAATEAAKATDLIKGANLKLGKGDTDKAIEDLRAALKVSGDSEHAQCYYLLGEAYLNQKKYARARNYYRKAIRAGKGSDFAQKANLAMMKLPANYLKPRTGPQTKLLARLFGFGRHRGDGASPKPTIIDFYASWCNPCQKLDVSLEKIKKEYGDQLTIMKVDVDDPKNDELIDQYEVSPIPTMVFLNADGEVVTYSIGYAGDNGVNAGIKKILGNAG